MAEEKKKSKGETRYGKGPKIEAAEKKGDTDKSGHQEDAKKEAESSAASAEPHAEMDTDKGPEGTEAAGTGDVPVSERHSAEMKEMHGRQRKEMTDMHARHRDEHSKLTGRHLKEMASGSAEESGEE